MTKDLSDEEKEALDKELLKKKMDIWNKNPFPSWLSDHFTTFDDGTYNSFSFEVMRTTQIALHKHLFKDGRTLSISIAGHTKKKVTDDYFDGWRLLTMGGRFDDGNDAAVFVRDERIIWWVDSFVTGYNFSPDQVEELKEAFDYEDDPEIPTVNLLVPTAKGLGTTDVEIDQSEFISENYNPTVTEKFENMKRDCTGKDPKGRISVISGPPGTGKTRLIMALVSSIHDKADILLIPSSLVQSIVDPGLVNALLDFRSEKKPMVLVIEDADEAIRKRKGAGDSALSALLNLSDGLFGQILDTRIVCTTNIMQNDIDPAIYRPGRLCSYFYVGALDQAQSQKVYDRLGGKGELKAKEYTLAQIYAMAQGLETAADEPEKPKIGF